MWILSEEQLSVVLCRIMFQDVNIFAHIILSHENMF